MSVESPVLEVEDLYVSVARPNGDRAMVVRGVSFQIDAGNRVGLVGESGSGKTMTSLAIMGLLPVGARVESGSVRLEGKNLLQLSARQLQRLRGSHMAMVLQDAMTALDPSFSIGSQLAAPLRRHKHLRGKALDEAMVASLERVHLSAAKERLRQYPHQLSGGMRQRVTSAIALAGDPRLLIADEPTSALDTATQLRYLQLIDELQATEAFALLFVTHDLSVVREVCDRVMVMYSGEIVEEGEVGQIFDAPRHPYSRALLDAIPQIGQTKPLKAIVGAPPEAGAQIAGCRFAARCRHSREICEKQPPKLSERSPGQRAACWATEPGGWLA
jgi:oligopeptide/dipeptide ABC transporter ATP-binding protein